MRRGPAETPAAAPRAKAGVIALTKSIARETGRQGVVANVVSPGVTDTPLQRHQDQKVIEKMIRLVTLKRLGVPAEVPALLERLAWKRAPREPSAPLPFMELSYFNSLGGFTLNGPDQSVQAISVTPPPGYSLGIYSTPAVWNGVVFIAAGNDALRAFPISGAALTTSATSLSSTPACPI